jgi:hypothetical protein
MSRIGQHSFRQLSKIFLHCLHQWQELAVISRVVGKPTGDNELTVGIERWLGVVALFNPDCAEENR